MKKQILSWILALLLMLTPVLAMAEGEGTDPSAADESQGSSPAMSAKSEDEQLKIDTYWKYPDMDKSYAGGYTPTEGDGSVLFIMPLVGKTQGNVIRVVPEIPDGPFASSNLQFDVRQQTYDVSWGRDNSKTGRSTAYLIKFSVPLKSGYYNGSYTVTLRVSYKTTSGDPAEQMFTMRMQLTKGKNQSSGGGGGGPTTVKKPVILIQNCLIAPREVSGGERTSVQVSMSNVGNYDAKNIRVALVPESESVRLIGDLNARFFDALAVKGDLETTFELDVAPGTPEGTALFSVQITYEDKYGGSYTEEGKYGIEITQPKLDFTGAVFGNAVEGGASFPVTVTLRNTGTRDAKNVVVRFVSEDGMIACADEKDRQTVALLEKENAAILHFDLNALSSAPAGSHAFRFECSYSDGTGYGEFATESAYSVTVTQPRLEITGTEYSDTVDGGADFTFTLTVTNTGSRDARNVVVQYAAEDEAIRNKGAKDYQTIELLGKGESATVTFDLRALPSASEGRHTIRFDCSCLETAEDEPVYGTYLLSVAQKASLGFDEIRLPEVLTSGESFTLPICVYNTGFSPIYNVRCALNCDGLICSSAFLGNLAPQESADKAVTVFVTTLSGSQKYGEMYGSVEISYEDENGEKQYQYQDVKSTVAEPVKITDEEKAKQEQEQKEQQTLSQWWISLLVAIAIIVILVAIILIARFARLMRMK